MTQRLNNLSSSEVTLGIRPADLNFNKSVSADHALDVNIVLSEYIGAQSVLIGECGSQKVLVELKSDTPIALGNILRFEVDLEHIHIFDKSTDLAVS